MKSDVGIAINNRNKFHIVDELKLKKIPTTQSLVISFCLWTSLLIQQQVTCG